MSDVEKDGRAGRSEFSQIQSETSKEDQMAKRLQGEDWIAMKRAVQHLRTLGTIVSKVTLRGGWSGEVDILIILCADTPDGPVVAFHGAENVATMWGRLARRIMHDSLVWRPDDG